MTSSPVKLNIGCGNNKMPGWINIDSVAEFEPDVLHDITQPLPYDDLSVEEINADGILEHFDKYSRHIVFYEWVRVLKLGGRIRIGVPNFQKILYRYFKFDFYDFVDTIFGENMLESDVYIGHFGNHKWGYSAASLKDFVCAFGVETVRVDIQSLILRLVGTKQRHISREEFDTLKVYSSANASGVGASELTMAQVKERMRVFNG